LIDPITHIGQSLKLFGREIIFEEFQPIWSRYLSVTDRRTDDIPSHNRDRAVKSEPSKVIKMNNTFSFYVSIHRRPIMRCCLPATVELLHNTHRLYFPQECLQSANHWMFRRCCRQHFKHNSNALAPYSLVTSEPNQRLLAECRRRAAIAEVLLRSMHCNEFNTLGTVLY